MSLTEAQVQFAAEFVTLVVTVAALALVIARPGMRNYGRPGDIERWGWIPASFALVVLGGASFARGSLLVTGRPVEWLGLARLVAAGLLFAVFPYQGRKRAAPALTAAGCVLWMAAGTVELASGPAYLVDGILVAGSLSLAAAFVGSAQRSVAARVAAGAAATLLLVVVVLALALSTVISSSVQHQELDQLASRARVQEATITDTRPVSASAALVEADLAGYFAQANPNPLFEFASGDPQQVSAAAAVISARLESLNAPALNGDLAYSNLAYSNWAGTLTIYPGNPLPVHAPGFGAGIDLAPYSCAQGRQGLFASGASVYAAASSPECTSGGRKLGVAISSVELNDSYVGARRSVDPSAALALLLGDRVVATAGMTPAEAERAVAGVSGASGNLVAEARGDQFVSLAIVPVAGAQPHLTVLLTSPATTVLSTRNQLFRTLFLISFGGTILALGLAIFTGDRITAGLRRLTRAAAAIQSGEPHVRSGVTGEDEVAALGTAFDAMLDSVAAQAAALQAAAEDEARLRNRLEAVVAGMTDALVAVDPYGRITDFNRAAEALTGISASRARGAPAEQVVRLCTEEGVAVGRRLFRAGARDTAMLGYVKRGEEEIPVAVSSGRLRGPAGETAGTVLVFRDMRREREVERMKTEFLSRVGHELRTPLTGILGYADILLRRDVPAERARSWHEEILHSARRLLRIVEMLEFFASEGAGRMMLRPEPVDVRALVNGIASSWNDRLPTNVTLGRRIAKEEAFVSADRRWLSLAVDELIDNAVKFSPGGGRILVRVGSGDGVVEISVSDQGMGMSAEQQAVIFGDFVQVDSSDTRRFGGLGLGLAVVRRVADGLGGTIRCRSAPGRGATFTIVLPAWPAVSRFGAEPEQPANGGPGDNGSAGRAGRSPTGSRARS